jgi:hypothetical protein
MCFHHHIDAELIELIDLTSAILGVLSSNILRNVYKAFEETAGKDKFTLREEAKTIKLASEDRILLT